MRHFDENISKSILNSLHIFSNLCWYYSSFITCEWPHAVAVAYWPKGAQCPLGHGPLWPKKFLTWGKTLENLVSPPPPRCVSISGHRKFEPLYEIQYATGHSCISATLECWTGESHVNDDGESPACKNTKTSLLRQSVIRCKSVVAFKNADAQIKILFVLPNLTISWIPLTSRYCVYSLDGDNNSLPEIIAEKSLSHNLLARI